jgi:hypothetical protein
MNINEDYNITTDDVLASIKSIDDKLSMAKEGWSDAPVDKKSKWMVTINQLLDDRLSLMNMRDKYCS